MISVAGSSALRFFTPHAERTVLATRKAGSQAPWGPVFFFTLAELGSALFRAAVRAMRELPPSTLCQARARSLALAGERQHPGVRGRRQGKRRGAGNPGPARHANLSAPL